MAEQQNNSKSGWWAKRNRKAMAIAAGTMIVVGSAFGVQAVANSKTGAHLMVLAGGGGWHGGWHARGHHGRLADMTDAEIEKKVDRFVRHVAIEIDATADQQTKITKLFVAVAKEMKPLRGQMLESRQQIRSLLTAEKIDRDALERIRAARLADADRISKSIVNAVADAAEVLNTDQRKVLEERIEQFRSHRRGGGHGWGRGWHRG